MPEEDLWTARPGAHVDLRAFAIACAAHGKLRPLEDIAYELNVFPEALRELVELDEQFSWAYERGHRLALRDVLDTLKSIGNGRLGDFKAAQHRFQQLEEVSGGSRRERDITPKAAALGPGDPRVASDAELEERRKLRVAAQEEAYAPRGLR